MARIKEFNFKSYLHFFGMIAGVVISLKARLRGSVTFDFQACLIWIVYLLLLIIYFHSEGAQCLQASWFLFGLPRHFHLLLYNCLVLPLFVFCGKSNKVTKLQSRGNRQSLLPLPDISRKLEADCSQGNQWWKITYTVL